MIEAMQQSITSLVAQGLQFHQRGDLAQAETVYLAILERAPQNPDALHLMGSIRGRQGLTVEAIRFVEQAIKISPRISSYHNNLGNLKTSVGDIGGAEESYRRALGVDPKNAGARLNLGKLLNGKFCLKEARACFLASLRLAPKSIEGHMSLGRLEESEDKLRAALQSFSNAARIDPGYGPAHVAVGNVQVKLGAFDKAEASYRTAITTDQRYADAYYNLADFLRKQDRPSESLHFYRRLFELETSNDAGLYNNFGVVLDDQGFIEDAVRAYRRSLELDKTSAFARRNLGTALAHIGEDEGLEILEALVRDRPLDPDLHWCLGEKLLLHRKYESGWKEYEWRMQVESLRSQHRTFQQPRWGGELLEGKTILIYAEQGFGDTLQFVRFVKQVKERGGNVILEVQAALQGWLSKLPQVSICIPHGTPLPEFHTYAPLMSLPNILGVKAGQVTAPVSPEVPVQAERRVGHLARLQVGIVWKGNPGHRRDHLRSTRLSQWKGLAAIKNVDFISLQFGDATEETASEAHGFDFTTDCATVKDFADTAAILATLDLVITVDTSVAHLAASMGKPVWILLYNAVDWRWGLKGKDSEWYPTAQLFRQTTPGDWSEVFADLETSLRKLVDNR